MTESKDHNGDSGPLLWPRFFGPSIEYGRSASKYVTVTLAIIGTGLFLATGILLLSGTGVSGQATLNILIAFGIPVLYWVIRRNARTSMDYEAMRRRGELDWDLYENGILTREYAGDRQDRVRTVFFDFKRFSKAYVKINEQNARIVWELAKASAHKARKATGEEDVGADFRWDGNAERMVGGFIWLVDRESGRAGLRFDRDQLADPARFESILRRKLKDIE